MRGIIHLKKFPTFNIIIFLILFFFINIKIFPFQYYKSPENPKITYKLKNKLASLTDKDTLKVWIFFTDKGIFSNKQLEEKIENFRKNLSEKSLKRRAKVRPLKNLIDYHDLPVSQEYINQVKPLITKIRTQSRWLNAISVEATKAQILRIKELPFVRKIGLVNSFKRNDQEIIIKKTIKKDFNLYDSGYGNSWEQLAQINVPKLHFLGYTGKGVLICLLDTGFRKTHEVFKYTNVIAEKDFVNGDNDVQYDPEDENDYSDSHGTAVWSLIGGYKPGELIGVAYGADFLLAKTEHTEIEEPIEEDFWVAGVEWADTYGADVISSSLGYTDWYTFEDMDGETAITTIVADRAFALGIVVVTAAGNERNNEWGHIIAPADGKNVIAVGAVSKNGEIAYFSSPGPTYDGRIKPEVCACGVDDYVAYVDTEGNYGYTEGSGTSFSTPLVAGIIALLLEIHPEWTPTQIRNALLNTASKSNNPDNDYGWGIANAVLASGLQSQKKINKRR